MNYNVISCCSFRSDGEPEPQWYMRDIGMDRETATATMLMYAMRFDEWEGTHFVTAILKGADPEQPYACNNTDDAGDVSATTWFCIIENDSQMPPLPPCGIARPEPPTVA